MTRSGDSDRGACWRRALVAAALGLLASLPAVPAGGQERPRITVLTDRRSSALAQRMSSELGTLGFEARLVTSAGGEDRSSELEAATTREGAVVAVQVVQQGEVLKLWLFDRTTGKTVVRELDQTPRASDVTLAIRAVELLRASLLELALPEAPRGDARATPALIEAAGVPSIIPGPSLTPLQARANGRAVDPGAGAVSASEADAPAAQLSLEIGPTLMGSPGGLPPYAAIEGSIGVLLHNGLRLGALGLFPVQAMSHADAEGESETRVFLFGTDVRFDFLEGPVHPVVGAGVSLALLLTEGRGAAPYFRDASDELLSVGAYARGGVAIDVARSLAIRGEAVIGGQFEPFGLDYAGREVATWGAPWLGTWAALEARLP